MSSTAPTALEPLGEAPVSEDRHGVGRGVLVAAGVVLAACVVVAATRAGERAGRLSDWQALALGITQGLSEFLPISSSGHLILVPWLGDWRYLSDHPGFNKTFDVALHAGTLVAVVIYFGRDLWQLFVAWVGSIRRRSMTTTDERVAWAVVVATIPAALFGAVGESAIESRLGEPWQIAILLAVFATLLYVADRRPERMGLEGVTLRSAFGIGLAQALALMPGTSRSGITITVGRWIGLDRDAAARFSFLMLFPVVLGAVVLKGAQAAHNGLPAGWVGPFVVGTAAAAATGILAIAALLAYVRKHDYTPFVVYRLVIAALIFLVILAGWRDSSF